MITNTPEVLKEDDKKVKLDQLDITFGKLWGTAAPSIEELKKVTKQQLFGILYGMSPNTLKISLNKNRK